jgi:Zn-finger nucleic acid-binding protein
MRYTLKDFYTVDDMYYFPNIQLGVWVDEDEAQQIIDEMNEELEYDDEQAQRDAAMDDFGFGL